jgi:hypothetical protein
MYTSAFVSPKYLKIDEYPVVPQTITECYEMGLNTASTACWTLARDWISMCLTSHTHCKKTEKAGRFLPTRLIDVMSSTDRGNELRICSIGSEGIRRPYLTLSHRWGNANFLKLTISTCTRLQKGFALGQLPQTFQDAVIVSRTLGIKYLWIDALCIIQDSVADWQQEAATMADVYTHSICNISALDAQEGDGGLFFHRDQSSIPYCTIRSKQRFKRERVFDVISAKFWYENVVTAPLNRRGWVLQERHLAPRILYYGKQQLFWECSELRACESNPGGIPAVARRERHPRLSDLLNGPINAVRKGSHDSLSAKRHLLNFWADLLSTYTRCNLTRAEDRLVAISGLVKRLQLMFESEHIAGLWKAHLPEALLWHADPGKQERPQKYIAPSWSWACLDAPVYVDPSLRSSYARNLITIMDIRATPCTAESTAQIKDGFIRLRGNLFPADLFPADLSWTHDGQRRAHGLFYREGRSSGSLEIRNEMSIESTVRPDILAPQQGAKLVCLPVLGSRGQLVEIKGLVLEHAGQGSNVYQRWGWFSTYSTDIIRHFGYKIVNDEFFYTSPERNDEQMITLI